MGDVATIERPEKPLPAIAAGAPVRAIVPQTFDEAYRIANAVCKAGMAPAGLDSPEKAMIAIMHGAEVGLPPMQALQSIAVINGRPSIWGDGAIGLVRGSGLCEYVEETIAGDGNAMVATCTAKRRGEPSPITRTFSIADASAANLWNKAGPWKQYPKRMLQLRARAFALRDGFADVLRGLYIAEEAMDIQPMKDVTPPSAPRIAPPAPSADKEIPQDRSGTAREAPSTSEGREAAASDVGTKSAGRPPSPPKAAKAKPDETVDQDTGEITDAPAPPTAEEVEEAKYLDPEISASLKAGLLKRLATCKTQEQIEQWAQRARPALPTLQEEDREELQREWDARSAEVFEREGSDG